MATFRSAGQLSALSLFSLVALCVFGSIRQGSGSLNQASGLVTACLKEKNCWLNYRFNYPDQWTDCDGDQYVRRTDYGLFVGVVLCSSRRYTLYLSETLDGQYSHVADASGRAEDHCEFVGGSERTARTASYPHKAPKITGFYRWRWGERPQWGPIGNGPGGRLQSTGRYYVKWYECDVTIPGSSTVLDLNAADSISRESTREVPSRAAPAAGGVLAFTIRPTNTTVETGEPVTFECAVNQPGADITWYFNDDELYTDRSRGIDVDGSVVLIAEVTSRDAGEYECVASSDEGRPLQTSAFLRVVDFAVVEPQRVARQCTIAFDHVPSDAVVNSGRSHVFRCSPAKRSVDRVTWWRDGSQITTSGRFRVLVNGFLRIRRLTLGDSGVYTCVVRPKIGGHCSDAVIVQLTVNLNCGRTAEEAPSRATRRRGRIVGGSTASRWAAPWQVAIRYRRPLPGRASLVCGGVLIEHRWVVTTAHCFSGSESRLRPDQPEEVIVDLGERDRTVMETHQVTVGVERIFSHPNFNESTYDNDIALVQLENRVQFTDYIRPVCLASQKYQEDHFLRPNRTGTVTGWGRLGLRAPLASTLQEIHVPYVNESVCSASTTYAVTRNMFCAGYVQGEGVKQDACKGDSGGPLSMQQDGSHYLVGLVSWGEGCGARDKFGFYTKVANYYAWMMTSMRTA